VRADPEGAVIPRDKQRVADVGSPHKPGTVLKAGPEVSEVKFDWLPRPIFVSNEYLIDKEKKP
jgi:hypothetical protein